MARPQFDARDAPEHADVANMLGVLPDEHPAREAYRRGTGTLELTHLVAGQPELIEPLKGAWPTGHRRLLAPSGVFRP